ncbi:MAG: pitrilysin family protein [Armatimonadota bacterium]|nr:insulinase family protein [bacterium]
MAQRIFLAAILLFSLGCHASAQTSAMKITRMGNGLTVILQEDHSVELVGVDVWVKAGTINETDAINGVSHLIEHLAFGSTKKREAGDVDLEMESLGATLDAHTSRDWAHFSTTVPSRYLPKALDVLFDVVTGAQFKEDEMDRERTIVLQEISKKQTKPFEVCKDLLAHELYGNHPYALPIEGTVESVDKLTRQDVLDYYHKYYVPGNMAVVLMGDIDMQQAMDAIGKACQGMPNTAQPQTANRQVLPPEKQVVKTVKMPFNNNYVGIAFLGPKGSDYTDVCATDLLLTYIGFGQTNWMTDELVKKMGLATETTADFLTHKDPAMISLIAATSEANVDKARDTIFAKIAEVKSQGISDFDLAQAKRYLLGQFAFENETYGGRANSDGFYFAVSDPEFAEKYIDCVQGITNDDIIRVAKSYLDPNHAVIVILQPNQGGTK